ncbi:putative glycerol-1-phosphate prenyltransferase [Bizionia echini]|uniref:Geranylgeranylglyceryl phosphate synthase n=1 Tax=Bizionia echini TaxID=649333 RepID=A0A1I4YY72_9FLAO|nr:geranylgeranylglyceryl/heptaprenylglyceryl phosphate synthase [Bizionia echini]SFN42723.1 putative glycerol-1-phosphate prenyltransferase [Bizionia echini]
MKTIYKHILQDATSGKKILAVLIDPDKIAIKHIPSFMGKVNKSVANYVFVGGSDVAEQQTEIVVQTIKKHTRLPIVLFPGDITQITNQADALLFLSLISGRNPDYLIGKHVEAVSKLKDSNLEIISTGYILIENGKQTAVQRVTETVPLQNNNIQLIADTAKAGELLGMKLIYLEAGSGALQPVSKEIIKKVKTNISIPLIVGGGIRNLKQLKQAYQAGADLVVIGTAFENDESFFDELQD